ncbi:SDR family NAD(P)-dependent oxidoreductase [Sphingomonas sp. BN140010]|uniref:SDR family NAD(P)-dependent oxidoreductase n=1 Tax=Sphingomonas arvum TaxID=2992113 RepID=A0ABT3JDY5_9SPHN|nr:SDR family NAD(P)-dependent oxidoreductase [Sphingomonas sp. BN140010]MCW3797219.1 SDR family NAD(P)-dependent oxidoreductase [Sphingomonas sp. BN140010]
MTTPRNGFGFATTASDVLDGIDLGGRRAVVTGGAAGIGFETCRALAAAGASVTLAVRNLTAGEQAVRELHGLTGNKQLAVEHLDISDLESVDAFARMWRGPLHMLINNAGVMAIPTRQVSRQGVELQLATNFLGHFHLAQALQLALAEEGGRIVAVSSSAHLMAPVFFGDTNFGFLPYDPVLAYAQSKTAVILMAVEANRRWSSSNVYANALNPGAIATGLQKHTGGLRTPKERQKSIAQGAATSVLLAASPLVKNVGGRYFEDCQEADVVTHRNPELSGVAPYALDQDNSARLWELADGWRQSPAP